MFLVVVFMLGIQEELLSGDGDCYISVDGDEEETGEL